MTTTSSSLGRTARGASVLVGLVLLGAIFSACGSSPKVASGSTTAPTVGGSPTTSAPTPASSSSSKLNSLLSSIKGGEKTTFKAVYTITDAGKTETVTIEQSPPKSLFAVNGVSVIDTGTTTYTCTSSTTCISESGANPLSSLINVFNPSTVLTSLQQAQAEADAHAAGDSLTFSTGTYAGKSTTCANISGAETAKYCVTDQGVLAYGSGGGAMFSLTSYSTSPAASDFAPPAGATVVTIPAGVPN